MKYENTFFPRREKVAEQMKYENTFFPRREKVAKQMKYENTFSTYGKNKKQK